MYVDNDEEATQFEISGLARPMSNGAIEIASVSSNRRHNPQAVCLVGTYDKNYERIIRKIGNYNRYIANIN